jgi:hypothetical protein
MGVGLSSRPDKFTSCPERGGGVDGVAGRVPALLLSASDEPKDDVGRAGGSSKQNNDSSISEE